MEFDVTERICPIPDCGKPLHSHGLCGAHAQRLRRHGDPLAGAPARFKPHDLQRRLWAKVEKTETCWVFTGRLNPDGYGKVADDYAHRLAWVDTGHVLITGMTLDHLCRNRACVNPDHLEQITHGENVRRANLYRYRSD